MAKGKFYNKLDMLSDILPSSMKLSDETKNEISMMADFVCVFWAKWFLQSYLSTYATISCLKKYQEMREYKIYLQENPMSNEKLINSVEEVMSNMERHRSYLDESMIPICMANPDLTDHEKESLAKIIFTIPVPVSFIKNDPPLFVELNWNLEIIDILCSLVGPRTWLLFKMLGIENTKDHYWMNCPASTWQYNSEFKLLEGFAFNVEVVNDCSERYVKLVTDFINEFHDEDDRQDLLQAVAGRRELLRGVQSKSSLQSAYENIQNQ